mmetsp:Transcript_129501/g.242234  ORF Transcript_129501/g.242234 Transcript_129501/m.242234 type:complete len:210 (-) Transcript_129501:253-882(-)
MGFERWQVLLLIISLAPSHSVFTLLELADRADEWLRLAARPRRPGGLHLGLRLRLQRRHLIIVVVLAQLCLWLGLRFDALKLLQRWHLIILILGDTFRGLIQPLGHLLTNATKDVCFVISSEGRRSLGACSGVLAIIAPGCRGLWSLLCDVAGAEGVSTCNLRGDAFPEVCCGCLRCALEGLPFLVHSCTPTTQLLIELFPAGSRGCCG